MSTNPFQQRPATPFPAADREDPKETHARTDYFAVNVRGEDGDVVAYFGPSKKEIVEGEKVSSGPASGSREILRIPAPVVDILREQEAAIEWSYEDWIEQLARRISRAFVRYRGGGEPSIQTKKIRPSED